MSADVYKAVCARLMQVDYTRPLNLCCSCLKYVGKDDSSVDDVVVLSFHSGEKPVTRKISDVLKVLIDESFSEVMNILKSVCKQCLKTAIDGYKLIKNCKNNCKILYNAVSNLELSLTALPTDMYNYKSLYVAINPKEIAENFEIKRYFDSKQHFIPQDTGLPRFNMILNYLYPKTNLCSKENVETKDMLYDPTNPNEYKCVICQKMFKNSTRIRTHFFRQHHHSKDVKCKECDDHSHQFLHSNLHEEANPESKQDFKIDEVHCSQEGRQFQDRTEQIDTVDTLATASEVTTSDTGKQNTESESSHTCSNCGLTFTDLHLYNKHVELQSNCKDARGRYYCDYCNRCYSYKPGVRQHILREHMGKGTPCEICGKRYMNMSSLNNHMKTHTQEKAAVCVECGKTFRQEEYLKYHMRIHTGERPYQCEICYKTFRHPQHLLQHSKTHQSKIECKFCHNMYKRSSMPKHIQRSHFGKNKSGLLNKKTYSCKYCNTNMVFDDNYELKLHIKSHMAERQCNICSKEFTTKPHLTRHKKKHFDPRSKLYIEDIDQLDIEGNAET